MCCRLTLGENKGVFPPIMQSVYQNSAVPPKMIRLDIIENS